jgi:hypothetical protein
LDSTTGWQDVVFRFMLFTFTLKRTARDNSRDLELRRHVGA